MEEGGPQSRYVKLTKEQAPLEDIKPVENYKIIVLHCRKCNECGQALPESFEPPANEPWTTGIFGCAEDTESCGIALAAATAVFHGIDPRTSFLICEGLLFSWWVCGIYTGLFRQSLQKKYHLKNSPCDPCAVHCTMHWCALCQEHREMKGRLSDDVVMSMTIVNPPPVQEMTSDGNGTALSSAKSEEHTNLEMQAL
ncbi:PLAC8 family protein [Actinidia rufa]|uniref:PLAC8 family protein n=1 Tax=Actinidia rufa TaxID=165716 RepID=A0A7J0GWM5_9ERIC|nr:PLAC8 family protein [Actinidia rufa]